MTILEMCEVRKKENFPKAIWLEEPRNYPYVRESKFYCCSSRYIPMKKRTCLLKTPLIEKVVPCKLVGYTKPKYKGNHIYEGTFWWVKGYDLGMPYEKFGYGEERRWKDGKKYGITIIPCEAVKF